MMETAAVEPDAGAAAVILCGGQSRRMGAPKAWLPFGDETLLQRTVRVVGPAVARVIVAAAPGQLLPQLPPVVVVVQEEQPGEGPLHGILQGLRACRRMGLSRAFVCSTDLPFLETGFVRFVLSQLNDVDVAVPRVGGKLHPLAAAYSVALEPVVEQLLASGERRPRALYDRVRTRLLEEEDLAAYPGAVRTLTNINTIEDYARALAHFLAARSASE